MTKAEQVHIAYDGKSTMSLFDAGMAFALGKPLVPITGYFPNIKSNGKCFSNMIWAWNSESLEGRN